MIRLQLVEGNVVITVKLETVLSFHDRLFSVVQSLFIVGHFFFVGLFCFLNFAEEWNYMVYYIFI